LNEPRLVGGRLLLAPNDCGLAGFGGVALFGARRLTKQSDCCQSTLDA
jgi:hypothetical protein